SFRSPLPGEVKSRAMGDAGADDGKAKSNIDRSVHPQQLEGDVPLVMIHGNDSVKVPRRGSDHQRVAGEGAFEAESFQLSRPNCWADDLRLLITEQTLFAGMRIECRHTNPRLDDLEFFR